MNDLTTKTKQYAKQRHGHMWHREAYATLEMCFGPSHFSNRSNVQLTQTQPVSLIKIKSTEYEELSRNREATREYNYVDNHFTLGTNKIVCKCNLSANVLKYRHETDSK